MESLYSNDEIFILWDHHGKDVIPPRPELPSLFPETDARHWYDLEYVGIDSTKLPMPFSDTMGAKGKRTIAILPCKHPYHLSFAESMQETSETFGMYVKILYGDATYESIDRLVDEAIAEKPDLIFLNPSFMKESPELFKRIYHNHIPAIACNMIPDADAFQYFLSWTGPDAWGETRLLARKLADLMKGKGGYAIIQHSPENSTFYSRTWSVITELHDQYPDMELLAKKSSHVDVEQTEKLVSHWIDTYGSKLKGIVSCDDDYVMRGIIKSLDKKGRNDIICVSNGSTKVGMDFLRKGNIDAMCLKSPIVDGATPVKIAVDWFNGLKIQPMVYLPKHIITRDDVDDMFLSNYEIKKIGLNTLMQVIQDGQEDQLERIFQTFYEKFRKSRVVSLEYFRGFTIDFISGLLGIMKSYDINIEQLIGTYENLFKNLFMQKTVENTLSWLFKLSKDLQQEIMRKHNRTSKIDRVMQYINANFTKPLSLKILAQEFSLTSKHLGQEITKATGMRFNDYLAYKRIETAKELLAKTSFTTLEIAERIGFSNPNYFYTVFKKYEGCSPKQYRSHGE